MNYKILDKIGGERETWIVVSFFLIFVVCISWWFDTGKGYFLRFWNGTSIEIGNVELTVPNDYYIGEKHKDKYFISDVDKKSQFYIRAWNGTPEIPKIKERVKAAGGEVHSYNMNGYFVYEFSVRSDTWDEYAGVVYLFPQLHIQVTYIGSFIRMYPTMNEFVQAFKIIPGKNGVRGNSGDTIPN